VIRVIDGFHQDEEGDWVAELSCLHNQHVRHRPPFWDRPWVTSEVERADRIGSPLDCPLCDRMELPSGLAVVRTAGPFDDQTLPAALRRAHLVADRTWGLLRVLEGSVGFAIETTPPVSVLVVAGQEQPIPPGVPHLVQVDGPVRLVVDFLVQPRASVGPAAH
jgi:tellurite methyltransferase